jgi:hypothetical protein
LTPIFSNASTKIVATVCDICASRLRCGIFEVRSVHIAGSRSFYGAGQLEEPRSISFARLEQSRGRRA